MSVKQKSAVLALLMMALSACSSSSGSAAESSTTAAADTTGSASTSEGTTQNVTTTSGALQITGTPPTQVGVGGDYYFNANYTGGTGTSRAFSITNKPSWATFNTATGELKGTPTAAGTFASVKVTVSDGSTSSSTAAFTITVGNGGTTSGSTTDTSGKVTLSWTAPSRNTDGTSLSDLAGYVIHYGASSTTLDKQVTIGSAAIASYTVTSLTKGKTYYFTVTAVNTGNAQGKSSSMVSVAI